MEIWYLKIESNPTKYNLINNLLGVEPTDTSCGWEYRIEENESSGVNRMDFFIGLLDNKIERLKEIIGNEELDITLWFLYEYEEHENEKKKNEDAFNFSVL